MRNKLVCTVAVLVATILSLLLSINSSAQLNEWVANHPTDSEYNLGGLVADISIGADGEYFIRSHRRSYSRSSHEQPWSQYTSVVNGLPVPVGFYFPHPTIPGRMTANALNGKVFRSEDSGRNWVNISNRSSLTLLSVSPTNPLHMYAWNYLNQILEVSFDEGVTWTEIFSKDLGSQPRGFKIDPLDPNSVYARDSKNILMKSVDAGVNWRSLHQDTGLELSVYDYAIDQVNPKLMYAVGFGDASVFRSADGGSSWTPSEPPGFSGILHSIDIDPNNSERLLIAGAKSRLYESLNSGATWTKLNEEFGDNDWYGVTIAPNGIALFRGPTGVGVLDESATVYLANEGFSSPNIEYLVRSADESRFTYGGGIGGLVVHDALIDKWYPSNRPFHSQISGLSVDRQDSSHMLVASRNSGFFETSDAGLNWNELPLPEPAINALDIKLAPSKSEVIYGFTRYGLYRTENRGDQWDSIYPFGFFDFPELVIPIVVSPVSSDIVFMIIKDDGLFTTVDGGLTWKNWAEFFQSVKVSDVAIDPLNPETVYASILSGRIWRSDDSGQNWYEVTTEPLGSNINSIAVDSFVSGRLYATVDTPTPGINYETLTIYEPAFDKWFAIDAGMHSSCNNEFFDISICDVIADNERQGYLEVVMPGSLYSFQRDFDLDELGDDVDNCTYVANSMQRDTDSDGLGNACDPDYNNDLIVNFLDVVEFQAAFNSNNANIDINGDGIVNFIDLDSLKNYFLQQPGPGSLGYVPLEQ